MRIRRTAIVLKPDNSRVFFRAFEFTNRERVLKIIARVMSLSELEAERRAQAVLRDFADRHQRLRVFLLKRFEQLRDHLITDQRLSEARQLLLGAYFSQEYSLEAAALFNPSLVPHPDQSDLPEGSVRFVLSLRATGEGHISSIVFRSGVIDREARVTVKTPTRFVNAGEVLTNPAYDKKLFERKLFELGLLSDFAQKILSLLEDTFTFDQLKALVDREQRRTRATPGAQLETARAVLSVAQANYEIHFDPTQRLSERVIFPTSPAEVRGIEDARFVAFREGDGSTAYYATYTAYDSQVVLPQMLETRDFVHFKISTLNGPEMQNKGMALFPRKINGRFAMLSRQDNENIYLMYSDMLHFWHHKQILMRPTYPWEYIQIGNCGSPIETESGWLVLTHGVGPMRKYSIGAVLLDRDDPTRVIGRLREPLIKPNENEREGYVPNVVYSCGSLLRGRELVIPYAMSDYATTFASLPLDEVLGAME